MRLPSGKWKLFASPIPKHPNNKPPLKSWLRQSACPAVCAREGRAHKLGQGWGGDSSLWATLKHEGGAGRGPECLTPALGHHCLAPGV